jgi:plastocyanin
MAPTFQEWKINKIIKRNHMQKNNNTALILVGVIILGIIGAVVWRAKSINNSSVTSSDELMKQYPATREDIMIMGSAFTPPTKTVKRNTTVQWISHDNVQHTVTGKGFDSKSLSGGQTYQYTFTQPGTYEYGCTLHPNMKGKIIVE